MNLFNEGIDKALHILEKGNIMLKKQQYEALTAIVVDISDWFIFFNHILINNNTSYMQNLAKARTRRKTGCERSASIDQMAHFMHQSSPEFLRAFVSWRSAKGTQALQGASLHGTNIEKYLGNYSDPSLIVCYPLTKRSNYEMFLSINMAWMIRCVVKLR